MLLNARLDRLDGYAIGLSGLCMVHCLASAIFVVIYLFSSLVVGPAITGVSAADAGPAPSSTALPSDHDEHH